MFSPELVVPIFYFFLPLQGSRGVTSFVIFEEGAAALRRILCEPRSRTVSAVRAQQAMTPVMGRAVWLLRKLTRAEAKAPMLIWIPPRRADAVPALRPKSARDRAEELGKMQPWQQRKRKQNVMEPKRPSQPIKLPVKSRMAVRD